jgi:hypothetical protein
VALEIPTLMLCGEARSTAESAFLLIAPNTDYIISHELSGRTPAAAKELSYEKA